MVSAPAGFLVETQIHVLFLNLSLIPVLGLRGRTELVCAHGKRHPGIKFTGLEFCLPFAQTVNWPVFPCKWPWKTVNNLYFGNWHFINILLDKQFVIHLYRSVSWEFYLQCQTHKMNKKALGTKIKYWLGNMMYTYATLEQTLPNITDN